MSWAGFRRAGRVVLASSGVAIVLVGTGIGSAHAAPSYPRFTAPVVDVPNVIPAAAEQNLDRELQAYQNSTGNQIAVAIVKTTGGESIESYSKGLANAWGVGQQGANNGVLLVIAYADHRLRIEVGDGFSDQLDDEQASGIISEQIVPEMRAGNVAAAVAQGTTAIRAAIDGTDPIDGGFDPGIDQSVGYTNHSSSSSDGGSSAFGGIVIFAIIAIVLVLIAVRAGLGRGTSSGWSTPSHYGNWGGYGYGYRRNPGFWGMFNSGNSGSSGWSGGGGSGGGSGFSGGGGGGGFSGGGGGGFSGGGASGSW